MTYDLYEASRKLGRLNLNLGNGIPGLIGYWCRVVVAEREIPNPNPHTHSFFELHLCLDGCGVYTVSDKRVELCKNQYILLAPHTRHRIESENDGYRKFIWGFAVRNESVKNALASALEACEIMQASDEVLSAVDIILRNAYFAEYGYYDVIKGQLFNIFAHLTRSCTELCDADNFCKHPSYIVKDIRTYISDNLRLNPSTEEIAMQFSKSPGTIDKLCRSECGMTVSALKKQLQFEKVKQLLSESDLTLDKIAEICGFADRYTLGKFFRKSEGVPPGEFRKSITK